MARISAVKMDLDKATNGRWVPFELDVEFKIASFESPTYQKARRAFVRANREAWGACDGDDELMRKLLAPVVAETILVGWKNLEDEETGEPLEYSVDEAKKILTDPAFFNWLTFVWMVAQNFSAFRCEAKKADAKN